jgi:hypothetical protein
MPTFNPPLDPSDPSPSPRETWLPRIRAGYLYINDRVFYLYSKKKTVTLRDATRLVFGLTATPIPNSVVVLVEGVPYTNFTVEGTDLVLKLDDQESFVALWNLLQYDLTQWDFVLHGFGFGPSNQIQVTYQTLVWQDVSLFPEPTGNTFQEVEATEVFRIKDADRVEYQLTKRDTIVEPTGTTLTAETLPVPSGFLPDPPVDCAPVVITDDTYQLTDRRGFQTEFRIDPITAEIEFNAARNYLQNPSFEVAATGAQFDDPTYERPLEWRVTDTPNTPRRTDDPYHGLAYYEILGTGEITQKVRIDPRQPYTLSVFFRGTGELCANFLDASGVYFDAEGNLSTTGEPAAGLCVHSAIGVAEDWTRLLLTFGETDNRCDATGVYPQIPPSAEMLEFKLRNAGAGVDVDAAVVEVGYVPTDFEPLDLSITIEYETDRRGYWQPNPLAQLPLEIHNLDLNPVNVVVPGGFLLAEEFSSVDDYQLGPGAFTADESTSPTGVLQITGSVGVQVGRRDLPYAQVSGFYKFRHRETFHHPNPPFVDDISDLTIEGGNPMPVPAGIAWTPRDGLRVVGEDEQLVVVPDDRIAIRIDAFVFDAFENPAFTFTATVTATNGQVTPPDPITSHAGQLSFTYRPPNTSGFGSLGQIDTITLQVGAVSKTLAVYGFRPSGTDFNTFLTS